MALSETNESEQSVKKAIQIINETAQNLHLNYSHYNIDEWRALLLCLESMELASSKG